MKQHEITTVIWDGDHTLWDWLRYAVPAYEAMCGAIASYASKSFDVTAAAMKEFYTKKGTLEDEGLIQGLHAAGFFQHMPDFDLEVAIQMAQQAFNRERKEHFQVYPGVAETIAAVHERGWRQIVMSDAPAVQARARLDRSGLSSRIHSLYTMPAAVVPNLPRAKKPDTVGKRGEARPAYHILPNMKPHIDLTDILNMTIEDIAARVIIIGDHFLKDMGLAVAHGCRGLHARYGVASPDQIEKMGRFSPHHVAQRNMQIIPQGSLATSPRIQVVDDSRRMMEYVLGER